MATSSHARQHRTAVQRRSLETSSSTMQTRRAPSLQLLASDSAPVQRQDCNELGFTPGELTINGEGAGDETLHLHWPGNSASGVTIGYGYDLGQRSKTEIRGHMSAAGLPESQIAILENASGVMGSAAGAFVTNNSAAFGSITEAQRVSIFQNIMPQYESRARGRATTEFYGAGAANYNTDWQLTDEQYNALHPAIHELLVDLTFQGAYSNGSSWGGSYARINPILVSDDDNITKMENLVQALRDYLAEGNLPSGAPRRTNLRIQMLESAIAAARQQCEAAPEEAAQSTNGGSTTAVEEQSNEDSNGWLPDWLRWPWGS